MKVGVYIHDGFTFAPRAECPYYWDGAASERLLDWLGAMGVQIVEYFPQFAWYRYPTLPEELDRLRGRQRLITAAHQRGLEFWQMLGTNLSSRRPADEVPPGQLELAETDCTQCPQQGDGFVRTAELGRYFARCSRGADAFEVIAGDWGGCRCGRCSVEQYLQYLQFYAEHLAREHPGAILWANLWSISSWQAREDGEPHDPHDARWRRYWDDEIAASQRFLARLDQLPPGIGIAFPLHHWYRGFCQRWYEEEELPFWPDLTLLWDLHRRGRPLLAWPHFIVENDPYHGRLWGTLSVRLRYLRQLCGLLAQAPFEDVMGNVYSGRQALNVYALGRFARQPDLPVETVIADFAAEVAQPHGAHLVQDLLLYLENRDPWHADLPPYRRLPPLSENRIRSAALEAALPTLVDHLLPDAPLLLNGARQFARTVAAAFTLAQEGG